MPHPPIIVPDVGRGREAEAAITLEGINKLIERLKELEIPDRILLLSPHQAYALGAYAVNKAPMIRGSLIPFGAPMIAFDMRTPMLEVDSLVSFLGARDVPVSLVESHDLTHDQGSLVPLYFIEGYCQYLPDIILSNPIGLDRKMSYKLGRELASFDDGKKWGLLASGDLSHRLKPGAPAGYSPAGEKLDRAIVEALKRVDASDLLEMPRKSVEDAGECGLRSVLALLGLVSELKGSIDVLSYEGPFGVGYCNALWAGRG
jgi:aromatic ring-opening dioxygenase LigB subunit